jgi:hypothetical protein
MMKNQELPLLKRPCLLKDKPGEAFAEGDVLTYIPRVLHREADAKTHCQMRGFQIVPFPERDPYAGPNDEASVLCSHIFMDRMVKFAEVLMVFTSEARDAAAKHLVEADP